MTNRRFHTALGLVAMMTLSACSSNPLLQSGSATSTDTAEQIEQALEPGQGRQQSREDETPEDIGAALMPDMAEPASVTDPDSERFNVSARDLAARTFFESLVSGSAYNVVVHPEVAASISMQLQQVTVPEVMEVAEDLYDLDIGRQGRLYRIRPGGQRTRVFQVDYLHMQRSGGSETQVRSGEVSSSRSSGNGDNDDQGGLVGTRIRTESHSDFWGDLRQSLNMIVGSEDGRKVIITPGAGMIVVRADQETLGDVEEYLRQLQLISERQVILEARIMEVELNEAYQQGVDWNYIDQLAGGNVSAGVTGGNVSNPRGSGGVFSTALDIGDFSTLIRLLGQQGNVQMLSSPRISTVNNEKAVIKVGSDEFFVTDIDFQDTGTAVAGGGDRRSTSVDLTPFFSGISLDVTPQISEDGMITLHVHPSVSEVEDQEKLITIGDEQVTLPLALSTVRETDSIINARSGQIVVIGGLIQNSSEEVTTAVPFFSEIPWLGELFKQRRFESRKSELVILLRPVITGEKVWQQDMSDSRDRVRALRELMESPESVTPQPAQSR